MQGRQTNHDQTGSTPGFKRLPEHLRPFFWDVPFDRLSVDESSCFIISRLMEHGDEAATRFLLTTFRPKELIHVLRTSRTLSRRSRAFWTVFFDLEDEPCTLKRYPTPFGDYFEG